MWVQGDIHRKKSKEALNIRQGNGVSNILSGVGDITINDNDKLYEVRQCMTTGNPQILIRGAICHQSIMHYRCHQNITCTRCHSYTPSGDQPMGEQEIKIRGMH